jgi:hypothetical protein
MWLRSMTPNTKIHAISWPRTPHFQKSKRNSSAGFNLHRSYTYPHLIFTFAFTSLTLRPILDLELRLNGHSRFLASHVITFP